MSHEDVDPGLSLSTPSGLLTLLGLRGVGPITAGLIASECQTAESVWRARETLSRSGISGQIIESLVDPRDWNTAWQLACGIVNRAASLGVRILSRYENDYPSLLRKIQDPPLLLYVRGNLHRDDFAVACVGTREPSRFGQEVAPRMASMFAGRAWSIVSGLAIGVDTLAHRGALNVGGHTVAILAHGLDIMVYPRSNIGLAQEIVTSGGALVSEQSFGVGVSRDALVRRNRIQSGLSAATVVMQSDIKGGSMHTARFALEQGRILAVPVPTGKHRLEAKSQGTIALAEKTGAELVGILNAKGSYREMLQRKFASIPPAIGVKGREDYEGLLHAMRDFVSDGKMLLPDRSVVLQMVLDHSARLSGVEAS